MSFEQIDDGEDIHGALHGVFIAEDLRWGFAVGNDGQAYWATDLATPSTWHQLDRIPAAYGEHLWESIWNDEWEGSVWEREAWIVGEGPTLLHKDAGETDFVPAAMVPAPPAGNGVLSIDFGDLHASAGSRHGAVGLLTQTTDGSGNPLGEGDTVAAIYVSADGVLWTPASVELPVGWGTGHNFLDQLAIWGIDFVPGDPLKGFAVGGNAIGNTHGYSWSTVDGGQKWEPLYTVCTHPSNLPCPPPNPIMPPPAPCTGDIPNAGAWGGTHLITDYATLYDVTAMPDGSALCVAYAGGVFRIDSTDGSIHGWHDVADSFTFATAPLWGVSEATSIDAMGQPKHALFLGGTFGDMRRSDDGGATWQNVVGGKPSRLKDIVFKLKQLRGQKVVVYFYPQDDTPG